MKEQLQYIHVDNRQLSELIGTKARFRSPLGGEVERVIWDFCNAHGQPYFFVKYNGAWLSVNLVDCLDIDNKPLWVYLDLIAKDHGFAHYKFTNKVTS